MLKNTKTNYLIPAAIFIGLPLLFWALGDTPERTVLKESLSVLTLVAFCLMLGQFFLARGTKSISSTYNVGSAIKTHKLIGYLVVLVILVHPFLIVLPRYYEAGIDPKEAFITMITTFESQGIVLGIIAWCLVLLLGVTSLIRKVLPINYKTWRIFHGVLSLLFISIATWHAVDLGRHTDLAMSIYMIILAVGGALLLLKTYIFESAQKTGEK